MTTLNDLNVRPKAVQETKTDKYIVWVGGTESDNMLEYDDAMRVSAYYKDRGHTDVIVECVECNELINFETKDFHGEIKKDFSYGWFEHNEHGEEWGGSFDIELDDNTWEIVDCDGCYDIPQEVVEMLENRISKPLTQS